MSAPETRRLFTLEDFHVAYGTVEAVHGVALHIDEGEVVTVIGPNGAGKSTLLNAAMGLLPSRGAVTFDGERIARPSVEAMVARGVALVPERRELFGEMPVEDNLLLGGFYRWRTGRRDQRARMDEVFAIFPRLKERRTQLASTLSGGERQMLAIGRALMARPRLLMLDEPSLGLAPLGIKQTFEVIQRINQAGTTVLLAEQNAFAALKIAHRAYVIESGRIVMEGDRESLMNNEAVRRAYIGA